MWSRVDLKQRGKTAFKRNYWICVLVALILLSFSGSRSNNTNNNNTTPGYQYSDSITNTAVSGGYDVFTSYLPGSVNTVVRVGTSGFIGVISLALAVFVISVLEVGGARFFTKNSWQPAKLNELLFGFKKDSYFNIVTTMFITNMQILLWTLVFIIPGIIKAYEYYMVPYILADDPYMDYKDVLALSKKMMDGNKWNTFLLELSFIGWEFLNVYTFGLSGILYSNPYKKATMAELYITLRDNISDIFSEEF